MKLLKKFIAEEFPLLTPLILFIEDESVYNELLGQKVMVLFEPKELGELSSQIGY